MGVWNGMICRLKSFESYKFDTSAISENNAQVYDYKIECLVLFGHFTKSAPICDWKGVATVEHFTSVSAYQIAVAFLPFVAKTQHSTL